MMKIKDLHISFGELIAARAEAFKTTTIEMGEALAEMGLKFGDTFALMTEFGGKWLDTFLDTLARAKGAASGGRRSGGRTADENNRIRGENVQNNIHALISTLATLTHGSPEWLEIKARIDELRKQLREIPGFARGVRNFRGGLARVGDRGPEIVRLPRGSDVIPNGQGAGGGGGTTINFNGPVYGFDDFRRKVAEAVRDTALGGGFEGVFE